ncbi:hypothetical protein GIW81_05130 [Hyphomicrobium sp. xq]|jgi:hypothetical protein|uniref:GcrA cell cycle regulator n=1 Tax=Hyphomicrobium album TaxID=2665159 RepID=A0A6I3KHX2_9HYPH|nr:GcrA family cell cycle regulator [Hyphomicrobium album]MTD93716.1 hypothetical protein [Hyphomicrobium album]
MSLFRAPPTPIQEDDVVVKAAQPKTMTTLLPNDCRWPIGDPLHADFHFCGLAKQDGGPYCADHMRQARTSSRPRTPTYISGARV